MTDLNIDILREQTKLFIELDPTEIVLTPVAKVSKPGGGFSYEDQPTRPPQVVKVIWQGGITSGITDTMDGSDVQWDIILVCEWDAQIEIRDHFNIGSVKYVVQGFSPSNEYEIKAGVKAYGVKPIGG